MEHAAPKSCLTPSLPICDEPHFNRRQDVNDKSKLTSAPACICSIVKSSVLPSWTSVPLSTYNTCEKVFQTSCRQAVLIFFIFFLEVQHKEDA